VVVNDSGTKAVKLHWIEALNEQTQWTSGADAQDWLYKLTGRKLSVSPQDIGALFEQLNFIREQVTSLHFGEPPALKRLQERLNGVSLAIHEEYAVDGLPLLMARQASNSDTDVLRSVCDTLLLQFAAFLSEAIATEPSSSPKVVRCEGLFREGRKERQRLGSLVNERESAWRAELSLLQEAAPEVVDEIQRCEDFFVFSAKAKFCSDACRFSTFQITKQLKEPGYMKEKQRRYRNRKEKQ
jgi:hypothetical protein